MFPSMRYRTLLLLALGLVPYICLAQQTQVYSNPAADYNKAMDLFKSERYSAAEHMFEQVAKQCDAQSDMRINSDYYAALCSMNLFHDDAEKRMMAFIDQHPQSPMVKKIDFQLGNYDYRKRKFKDALAWYCKVEPSNLDKDETTEFYFKRGYSNFHQKQFDSAKHDFAEVKDLGCTYSPAATYYYGFIAYDQKNYQTAINNFTTLKKDPNFGSVVPYYIAELYYLGGQYDKVPEYVLPLMDSAKNPNALFNEDGINKLLAESYYQMKQYDKAVPYYEKYARGGSLQENEAYELGYCYFQAGRYKDAVQYFQNAAYNNDSLAQNALYYLAADYMKTGEKQFASNEFAAVSKMDYDPKLKEDAMFNYAKLTYELSFDPFDQAIGVFNNYLTNYPNSPHKEEVYRYLVNMYSSTRNY